MQMPKGRLKNVLVFFNKEVKEEDKAHCMARSYEVITLLWEHKHMEKGHKVCVRWTTKTTGSVWEYGERNKGIAFSLKEAE